MEERYEYSDGEIIVEDNKVVITYNVECGEELYNMAVIDKKEFVNICLKMFDITTAVEREFDRTVRKIDHIIKSGRRTMKHWKRMQYLNLREVIIKMKNSLIERLIKEAEGGRNV